MDKTMKQKKDDCVADAIHKLVTLGLSDDTVLEWVWDEAIAASRGSRSLSAVPSEREIDIAEDAWYLLTCAKDNLLPGQYEQYEKKIQSILQRGIVG